MSIHKTSGQITPDKVCKMFKYSYYIHSLTYDLLIGRSKSLTMSTPTRVKKECMSSDSTIELLLIVILLVYNHMILVIKESLVGSSVDLRN